MAGTQPHIAVLGGGPGGYAAAIRASQLGARVTLIEKDKLGGTCMNRGCIPTKALLQAASYLDQLKKASAYGIRSGKITIDFERMMTHKDRIVGTLVHGVERLVKGNGIRLVKGTGRLLSDHEIEVESSSGKREVIQGDKLILAMGSKASSLSIPGIRSKGVMTSDEALQIEAVPKSLLVIGGGYIGLELATIYSRLGSKVIVVEKMPTIFPGEDEDLCKILTDALNQEGMEILTNTEVKRIDEDGRGELKTTLTSEAKGERVVEKILVATGRVPLVEEAAIGKCGVRFDGRGVSVNGKMESSVPGVYAVGDLAGGLLLAHVAYAEGMAAAENAMGGDSVMDYGVIPRCAYTFPELASVGLSEKNARDLPHDVRIGVFPFRYNGKALVSDEQVGLVKVVADALHGEILGVHVLGPHATELIAEASAIMHLEGTAEEFMSLIHAHPTLSEALGEAASDLIARAIHRPPAK